MRPSLKLVLPVAVLLFGVLTFAGLVKLRREPVREAAVTLPPLVRVQEVRRQTVRLDVRSHGDVEPGRESDLVAQVAGSVVQVTPELAVGAFFEKGDLLAVIDPRDYHIAVTQAEAHVAQAEVRLALEEREAEVARRDWATLGEGEADPLVLREPQLAEARANLGAARAALERARLDLARTDYRAPFRGRVRAKNVDLGEYVGPGTPLARLYSIDFAEVRLAIPADQIGYLDLPLGYERAANSSTPKARVLLRADLGGRSHEWEARIVRTEGAVDPTTRAFHAIARVDDPYATGADRPPLTAGLFVEAVIEGRLAPDAVLLPRSALKDRRRVLVVDDLGKLRFRSVGVRRFQGDFVIVDSGLEDGELVCVSALDIAVDGMEVRIDRSSPESVLGRSPFASVEEGAP